MKVDFLKHPCFSKKAHLKYGRIHLPVAPKCNLQCRYCIRKFDCIHESRPGVTSIVLNPEEALYRVDAILKRDENIKVIGVAGPGDALANEETFVVLEYINRHYPDVIICLSTNGVNLKRSMGRLVKIGLKHLTITINSVTPEVANKVYKWVNIDGKIILGKDCGEAITRLQWEGLGEAIKNEMLVKVNTVYIPGINDHEIPLIAYLCGKKGVHSMNIIPLLPQAEFADITPPDRRKITAMRDVCSRYVNQMSHCKHCRADACGKLSENKDMELESLNYAIGENYCEMVL